MKVIPQVRGASTVIEPPIALLFTASLVRLRVQKATRQSPLGGDTVTEFSPAAKAQLGTWDTKFDDDYAAWFAALPPPAPVAESGY